MSLHTFFKFMFLVKDKGSVMAKSMLASKNLPEAITKPSEGWHWIERSRMCKNDEIAGVLAWKCKKLKRLDHWDESGGKVIVLFCDHEHGHVGGGIHGEEVVFTLTELASVLDFQCRRSRRHILVHNE